MGESLAKITRKVGRNTEGMDMRKIAMLLAAMLAPGMIVGAALAQNAAKKDQSIAAHDMGAKKAEVDLGELGIKRRAILAPFNGVVDDVLKHQ